MLYGKVHGKMNKELKERTLPGTVTCLPNVHPLFPPHQYVFDSAGDNFPSLKLNFLDSRAPAFPPDTLLENKPGEGIGQGEFWFYYIGNTFSFCYFLLPHNARCCCAAFRYSNYLLNMKTKITHKGQHRRKKKRGQGICDIMGPLDQH